MFFFLLFWNSYPPSCSTLSSLSSFLGVSQNFSVFHTSSQEGPRNKRPDRDWAFSDCPSLPQQRDTLTTWYWRFIWGEQWFIIFSPGTWVFQTAWSWRHLVPQPIIALPFVCQDVILNALHSAQMLETSWARICATSLTRHWWIRIFVDPQLSLAPLTPNYPKGQESRSVSTSVWVS